MKKILLITFSLFAIFITGCKDKTYNIYMANVPVYMTYDEIKASIKSESSKVLENPGKIYFYQNYIFINEKYKGIHIIDNSNPANPINISFINIPANTDMAIKGNVLYVDNYKDLLSIDISDITNVKVLDRDKEIFPFTTPFINNNFPISEIDSTKGIVVGWTQEEVTEEQSEYYYGLQRGGGFNNERSPTATFDNFGGNEAPSGTGGSQARFTLVGDYLYAVHGSNLKSIDISNPTNPSLKNTTDLFRVVETIFPVKDKNKLFIGTTSGMIIYDLLNPSSPTYSSSFDHARNCDPVVVQGDYAYVTLRTGNNCGGWQNQLDVIDISSLNNPQLIKSYNFTNPHGLGIDSTTLFICDGTAGLKIYDASDVNQITANELSHFSDIQSYDVIPLTIGLKKVLLMIGADGFFQYDYTDINNITLLSSIKKGE